MSRESDKCPYCNSTLILPIKYGLMPDEIHQKNNENPKWVWGGCKLFSMGTKYCTNCKKGFGLGVDEKQLEASEKEVDDLNTRRKKGFRLSSFLD